MNVRVLACVAVTALLAPGAGARAQPATQPASAPASQPTAPGADPRDAEIFGEAPAPPDEQPAGQPPALGGTERDQAIFGAEAPAATTSRPATRPASTTPDLGRRLLQLGTDRLQIGGLLYLRFNLGLTDSDAVEDHPLSMPNLVDIYLDARPSDRLRALVRGRLHWNPAFDEDNPLAGVPGGGELCALADPTSSDPMAQALVGICAGGSQTSAELNELWLKFDIARRLWLTVGLQRVLWGATRLWNPVDVVNQSQRPVLSPFDPRGGVPMVKLHLPVESLGWNFYLAGLLDRVTSLDRAGVVGRGELVFSTVELGLVGAYREASDPTVGLDWSAGIWDFDLTGELALRFDERFDDDVALQSTLGLQYSMAVFDDDFFVVGGEYFYNQLGQDRVDLLGLFSGEAQFFYAGRHYGALFATLPGPAQLDDWTFTLSGVGNLSDKSFVLRFDLAVRVLTYLTVQAFVVGHLGEQGELRLGDDLWPTGVPRQIPDPQNPGQLLSLSIPTQVLDLGLWLSLDL